MAITILLGPPGSGKSYEATAFHVVPALAAGRKVITNVALKPEEIAKFIADEKERLEGSLAFRARQWLRAQLGKDPLPELVEFDESRLEVIQPSPENPRPFSRRQDYGDKTLSERGEGPLYVIDEAQKCLPAKGTDPAVFFWFTEHRHEYADVVLMTQQARQISPDIGGNAETVYKMRKNTNFGSTKSYRRLKLDGWQRSAMVVETKVRRYDPRYFPLYRSHTKNSGGQEADHKGRSIFLKWPFLGLALCLAFLVRGCATGALNPFSHVVKAPEKVVEKPVSAAPVPAAVVPAAVVPPAGGKSHPYEGWRMSIGAALMLSEGEQDLQDVYVRLVSPEGKDRVMRASEFEDEGYRVSLLKPCVIRLIYPKTGFFRDVRCAGRPVEEGHPPPPSREVSAYVGSSSGSPVVAPVPSGPVRSAPGSAAAMVSAGPRPVGSSVPFRP